MLSAHREVQEIARAVLVDIGQGIVPRDTEKSIASKAAEALHARGITETWYHDCPALVLLGSRSCWSGSGRHYQPAEEPVGELNVVTVDLSPCRQGVWGDCARTFLVENGKVVGEPGSAELAKGIPFLRSLHAQMAQFARPHTSFAELFFWANERITAAGFENLDFGRNVGHSIAAHRDHRQYLRAGNIAKLGEVALFTFEPHVREVGGRWGFKHEEIYRFDRNGHIEGL